jgi:hypothetical protein
LALNAQWLPDEYVFEDTEFNDLLGFFVEEAKKEKKNLSSQLFRDFIDWFDAHMVLFWYF